VLLVLDNMESVLPLPTDDTLAVSPDAAFEPEVLTHIFELAQHCNPWGARASFSPAVRPFQRRLSASISPWIAWSAARPSPW